jgi:hypothetical protein
MKVLRALSDRFQRGLARRPLAVSMLFVAALTSATAGLSRLQLDLSFRPLLATGEEIAEPTREFESIFGQSSGAWIVAIIENESAGVPELLRTTELLSAKARDIPHVVEVLSLTSANIPSWNGNRLSMVEPIPDYLLEPGEDEELEMQYESLLDGTRFVNWLVSPDGSRLLLAARVDLPMDDLDGRRDVIGNFTSRLKEAAPATVSLQFTGVSVVELQYEKQVLHDQLIATASTSAVLFVLLLISFGNLRAVIVCLVPVSLAIPATLGLMGWLSQSFTIIHTTIPAIVLIVGVADAVHMVTAWLESRSDNRSKARAVKAMVVMTSAACFFTAITIMGGFLSLLTAKLDMVASFGLCAAVGIFVAWSANQVIIPILLRHVDAGSGLSDNVANRCADRLVSNLLASAVARPIPVITGATTIAIGCLFLISELRIDQKFNEELPEDHEVSVAQAVLERDFGGFLGPELSIRRRDGGSMLDDTSMQRLAGFVRVVRALPETQHIWSARDLLTGTHSVESRAAALRAMRSLPDTRYQVRELVTEDLGRLAVIVRLGDIGTQRAGDYHEELTRIAAETWGSEYEVEIVGQWWLSQYGMRLLLRDMIVSMVTGFTVVLPMLWLALRERRLFIAATVANVLPLLLPLAFMAATGIVLRIGTVVVLAIALGIAVDNTLHIILRLRSCNDEKGEIATRIRRAMHGTGRAVLFTTLAIVGGFLSMMSNKLLAIHDMGIVAAVTFTGALIADLLVLPAVYALQQPAGTGATATESAVSKI